MFWRLPLTPRTARPAPGSPLTLRTALLQGAALLLFVGVLAFVGVQVAAGIGRNNINIDWSVLGRRSQFTDGTNLGSLLVGLWFTVRLALLSIVLALLLGTLVGVARLSSNVVVRSAAAFYVELFRNTPLLIQIFFWNFALVAALPREVRESLGTLLGTLFGTGPLLGEAVLASIGALSIYTSSYIAETVRAGIQSVPRGQFEAAASLGLSSTQLLTKIILPQALRVVISPLGNQFLNLTKNSSLVSVIGVGDLFYSNIQIQNYEGQGFVAIVSVTFGYLLLSLAITAALGLVQRRLALPSR